VGGRQHARCLIIAVFIRQSTLRYATGLFLRSQNPNRFVPRWAETPAPK
jgi:hypothetical protein